MYSFRPCFRVIAILFLGLFLVAQAHALSSKEWARINAMLSTLEKRSDLVFIRNGQEHNTAEAVSHLRLKLDNTRNRLETAEQFIDKVASSSSISGQPYFVRQRGKAPQPANTFLHNLLKQSAP